MISWKKITKTTLVLTLLVVGSRCGVVKQTIVNEPVKLNIPFGSLIIEAAILHNVPAALIAAVIHAESNFKPQAKSYAGAKGLMQINGITQRFLGVKNIYNPRENIHGGAKYLKYLLKKFNGNTKLAIAAYNAGPGAVKKHNGIPPYRETQKYVKKVLNYYASYDDVTPDIETFFSWFNS